MTAMVVLLVLAGAACGDDAPTERSDTAAVVDRAGWGASLEQACDELNAEYDDLVDTDPADRDEAVAYAERIEEFALASVEVLDGAGVPSDDRSRADTLAAHFDELAAAAGDLADAADATDPEAASDAAARIGEVGEKINQVAADLEVPSCGGY
jgi:methyl-accepting chemotaxis protein